MVERWKVFYNRNTGERYVSYTLNGEMSGEERATIELEAAERGINPADIAVKIEDRSLI